MKYPSNQTNQGILEILISSLLASTPPEANVYNLEVHIEPDGTYHVVQGGQVLITQTRVQMHAFTDLTTIKELVQRFLPDALAAYGKKLGDRDYIISDFDKRIVNIARSLGIEIDS